ncbi:MAG: hypothetical protein J5U19_12815 [Candidatus Methanoperedens sp.]|nr:hypothetical protein [Candidatus Methanoperedens sp.]
MNSNESLLKDEYLFLQESYDNVDRKCLDIKGWNITLSAALIAAGFQFHAENLFAVTALASMIFWYMEAFYRGLTFFVRNRIEQIEIVFQNGNCKSEKPLQIYSSWDKLFKKEGKQTLKYLFKGHVVLPHLFIMIICLFFYLLGGT